MKHIAVVCTVYDPKVHADVIVSKFLRGECLPVTRGAKHRQPVRLSAGCQQRQPPISNYPLLVSTCRIPDR